MTLLWLILLPAIAGLLALFLRPAWARALLVTIATAHLALTGLFALDLVERSFGAYLALDALGQLFLSILSLLFFLASWVSLMDLRGQTLGVRLYVACLLWFLAAMTLVTSTTHLALMWAAIEATTLASAPLVFFHKSKAALEATWKYLLICSVGIALALLGVFFLGIATASVGGAPSDLSLASLTSAAPGMSPLWLKAAFIFALVGFGTKMGLAPMHTWLPDTHSQAPAPVSALLSGALLNCAFLAILRFYDICAAAGAAPFAQNLLLLFGLLSITVASAFMLRQTDYKRLLAYSSIENMGIVAFGVGLGPSAHFGALLHTVNHSLAKAGLFFVAGSILHRCGTTDCRAIGDLRARMPKSAALLIVLTLALGGLPPFGLFISEFTIFNAALGSQSPWLAGVFLLLLALAFLGLFATLYPLVVRPAPESLHAEHGSSESFYSYMIPLALLIAVLVLGVYLPAPLAQLLRDASISLRG